MGKSYWFKDLPAENGQRGNFSNNKQDTFNPQDGFIGIRLQQGVPLLDRDWNELEDIRRFQEVMLRKNYIGDGTPDDGFKIRALDPPKRDFMISKGRFLVDGFEAVNEPDGSDFMQYSDQKGLPALTVVKAVPPLIIARRIDTVYLDIWIEEVTGADLPRLKNPDDVNMETCIRHRLRWAVRVDEGSIGHIPSVGHHFSDLAKITRTSLRDTIGNADIEDLRSEGQSLAPLGSARSKMRNAINSLMSGYMPSSPVMDLASITNGNPLDIAKDDMGNMILFWSQDNNIWARRYSASAEAWERGMQLTSGANSKNYKYSLCASNGDIWIFWYQQDADVSVSNIWAKRYNASTGKWAEDLQLTSGAAAKQWLRCFDDISGTIWFFWGAAEGTPTIYNYYCRRCSQGAWSREMQITSGTTGKSLSNIFVSSSGDIWFFWSQLESGLGISNLLARRFSEGAWSGNFALTSGTSNKNYCNSFEDNSGVIWFFWDQVDASSASTATAKNIWCRKFVSGNWTGELQLTTGTLVKYHFSSFADARGDVWFFWQQVDSATNFWAKRFSANAWSNDMQLTSGSTNKSISYPPIAGKIRDVFFAFSQADADNVYNILAMRFNFDSNAWETAAMTSGTESKTVRNILSFSNGDFGLFWVQDNDFMFRMFSASEKIWFGATRAANFASISFYKVIERANGDAWLLIRKSPFGNLWCVRYIDGDWLEEERMAGGNTRKSILDVFESVFGEVWAFWMNYSSVQPSPRQVMAKKFYDSV